MNKDITLKQEKDTCIRIIESQINILKKLEDIALIEKFFDEIHEEMMSVVYSKDILRDLKTKMIYQNNEYSKGFTFKIKQFTIKIK